MTEDEQYAADAAWAVERAHWGEVGRPPRIVPGGDIAPWSEIQARAGEPRTARELAEEDFTEERGHEHRHCIEPRRSGGTSASRA